MLVRRHSMCEEEEEKLGFMQLYVSMHISNINFSLFHKVK